MWTQADVSKNTKNKLRAIGQKGLEICVFRFHLFNYQNQIPDCFTNFQPLNLSNLNSVQLNQLGVKYEYSNDGGFARIALIKWRLDNVEHWPYINHMFEFIRDNKA